MFVSFWIIDSKVVFRLVICVSMVVLGRLGLFEMMWCKVCVFSNLFRFFSRVMCVLMGLK